MLYPSGPASTVLTLKVRLLVVPLGFLACVLGAPFDARGQSTEPPVELFGDPPPPVAPEVIARDGEGRATIRAVRLQEPLVADGDLTEALYRDVPGITGFIQVEPRAGEQATARTETWLAFDDVNVYVSFRCWDSRAWSAWSRPRCVATAAVLWQGNDIVAFMLRHVLRPAQLDSSSRSTPLGGRSDGQVMNERQFSADWNPVWGVKTGRFDGGWTVEAAIPFKSLRYQPGARRRSGASTPCASSASKNEISTLSRVPPARGTQGVQQASLRRDARRASQAPAAARAA